MGNNDSGEDTAIGKFAKWWAKKDASLGLIIVVPICVAFDVTIVPAAKVTASLAGAETEETDKSLPWWSATRAWKKAWDAIQNL